MEMSQAVRILASLSQSESEGNNLLDAASALAAACADLMGAARPENLQVSEEVLVREGGSGNRPCHLSEPTGDSGHGGRDGNQGGPAPAPGW